MREDTQFSCEYSYERRREGKGRLLALGLIALYISVAVLYFLFCYISGWIPLFAISPILLSVLIYFTWGRCFPDCYFEFYRGTLSVGYEAGRRKIRREKVKIHIKDADKIYPVGTGRVKFSGSVRVCDMSSSSMTEGRVCILWDGGGRAVLLDTTPALLKLLVSHAAEGCADELADYLRKSK